MPYAVIMEIVAAGSNVSDKQLLQILNLYVARLRHFIGGTGIVNLCLMVLHVGKMVCARALAVQATD